MVTQGTKREKSTHHASQAGERDPQKKEAGLSLSKAVNQPIIIVIVVGSNIDTKRDGMHLEIVSGRSSEGGVGSVARMHHACRVRPSRHASGRRDREGQDRRAAGQTRACGLEEIARECQREGE